jgi:hypothetical protein
MVGSLLLLLIVLIPAAIAGGIATAALMGVSASVAIVAGGAVAGAVLIFQAYLGITFIGERLERTDPAEVPGTD